ncbi:MAG: hypothetical protein QM820_24675 [Minicystis sp.]
MAFSFPDGGGLSDAPRAGLCDGAAIEGRGTVRAFDEIGSPNASSARITSSIDAKRSSGSFASVRITTSAASSGTAGLTSRIGLASSERMRAITCRPVPGQGSSPVSSSYASTPQEN